CNCPGPGPCPACDQEREASVRRKAVSPTPAPPGVGESEAPAAVQETLGAGGLPLDESVRADMEDRFGHDFSQVSIHTGPQAQRSAEAVQASAYTVGHNVVFGHGRYAPTSDAGRHLLAHELTHVIQQSSGASHIQRAPDVDVESPAKSLVDKYKLSRDSRPYF